MSTWQNTKSRSAVVVAVVRVRDEEEYKGMSIGFTHEREKWNTSASHAVLSSRLLLLMQDLPSNCV